MQILITKMARREKGELEQTHRPQKKHISPKDKRRVLESMRL
jgi:hypothetical protein